MKLQLNCQMIRVHERDPHGSSKNKQSSIDSSGSNCQRESWHCPKYTIMATYSIPLSLMLKFGNWSWWDWKFLSMDIPFILSDIFVEWDRMICNLHSLGYNWSPKIVELSAYCFIEYCSIGIAFLAHLSNLFLFFPSSLQGSLDLKLHNRTSFLLFTIPGIPTIDGTEI